jgi:isoleucyl-tRNA synthetase
MHIMADGLTRLLAPILSFTSDELWRYLPPAGMTGRGSAPSPANPAVPSVHMALFPTAEDLERFGNPALVERWNRLASVRERVLAEIEPLRKDKKIGSSLQARVVLTAPEAEFTFLSAHSTQLPMLFIVSDVELKQGADAALTIEIQRSTGSKCERCWRYVAAVSTDPAWAGLCDRCQDALAEPIHG